jgi:hypothetical protein
VNAQTGKLTIHFITPTTDTQNTLPLLHVSAADRHLQDAKPIAQALLLFFQLRTAAFKAYCAILVRRSNFRHQASPRDSTQRRKVELWTRNVR